MSRRKDSKKTMSSNHKLTAVIQGRTISGTSNSNDKMTVNFTDGSTLTIKTAGSSNSAVSGQTVQAVRQQDTTLSLDFENGTSLDIQTAEATSCVMARDKNHVMEYAD